MLITKPLPEEFSAGHLGRLNRLNGVGREKKDVYRMVKTACAAQTGHAPPTPVHAVASLIQIDSLQYLQHHSLLPFFGYAGQSDKAGQPSYWRTGHFKRFGFSAINPFVVLCKDCISEDMNFWGFSYWRREHQLLGARWCTRHGNVLHFVDKSDAFNYSPTEMLRHSHPYPVAGVLDNANEELRRYHQVINLMLEQGAPESLALMRDRLAVRAKNLGLSICMRSKSNRILSDRIVNIFPNDWLLEVFPRISGKSSGKGTAVLDNVLRTLKSGVVSAPAVATALVALFDDSQSAIAYVSSKLPPPSVSTVRFKSTPQQITKKNVATSADGNQLKAYKRQSRHSPISWQSCADAYIKYTGDIKAIAGSVGLSVEDTRWRLNTYRKHIFAALHQTTEYQAMVTFLSGISLEEASKKHNIPICSIEGLLRLLHRKMSRHESLQTSLQITEREVAPSSDLPQLSRRKRQARYSPVGWQSFADAYIKYNGDIKAIADTLGMTVDDARSRFNNSRRNICEALRETEEYQAMLTFLFGSSLNEASQEHDIPVCSIEALLRLLHRKMTLHEPLPDPLR